MNLSPLLNASPLILVHSAAAVLALIVGAAQFIGRKGVRTHRVLGWLWVISMMVVAISSFWIHEIRFWGNFSPIHLLAVLTCISVPIAVMAARKHNVAKHKSDMTKLYILALVVTGFFTLAPGRIMYRVFFGT